MLSNDADGNKRQTRSEKYAAWTVILCETGLIFALFFLYGAYPVPDVNEQYYVGKAIHFWNPDYFPSDAFLDTPDSHWFFCAVFGLFSKIFSPAVLVWFGRLTIWLAAAFGWQRLSDALVPRRLMSVVSAAIFLFLLENFHLAGEWIAGGVEGKGFAFPFVFLGLAALVRRRYNRAFVLFGIASAFHVLVGGWTVIAAFGAVGSLWLFGKKPKTFAPGAILPGLLIGGAISLFGLIPALALDWGATPAVVSQAHRIYVFERLSHHLVVSSLPWTFPLRFGLLTLLWIFFLRLIPKKSPLSCDHNASEPFGWRVWNRFVFVALAVALIGLCIDYGSLMAEKFCSVSRAWGANGLRFYFFRLSDWVIPAGCAFGSAAILADRLARRGDTAGALVSTRCWFVTAFFAFVPIKFGFHSLAERIALAHPAQTAWPALPKPTDGVAFLFTLFVVGAFGALRKKNRPAVRLFIAAALLAGGLYFGAEQLRVKTENVLPRSAPPKESICRGWLDVCRWAKANTPPDAVFLVPRGCDSLKWNAHRAAVGSWKEVPQDARSLVEWFKKMEALYTPLGDQSASRWNQPLCAILINKGRARFEKLAEEYQFDYIVSELPPYQIATYPKALERYNDYLKTEVYRNDQFVVIKIRPKEEGEGKMEN